MGLVSVGGLLASPLLYCHLRDRSKIFAPMLVKLHFQHPLYIETVRKYHPLVREQRVTSKGELPPQLTQDILRAFCEIKKEGYGQLIRDKVDDLSFYAESDDPKKFVKAYAKYGSKELVYLDDLLRHLLMDLGFNVAMEKRFMEDMYLQAHSHVYSEYLLEAYAHKFDPLTCSRGNLANIMKLLSVSQVSGRQLLFDTMYEQDAVSKRLVKDYFSYQYFLQNGVLLEPCYHYINLHTHHAKQKAFIRQIRRLDYDLGRVLEEAPSRQQLKAQVSRSAGTSSVYKYLGSSPRPPPDQEDKQLHLVDEQVDLELIKHFQRADGRQKKR